MSFLDDLNNAKENKVEREQEYKRKMEEEEQKKIEECLKEEYRRLKAEMLWVAEDGKKSIEYPLYVQPLGPYRVSIEEDSKAPKTAGQWIIKKYGFKRLIRECGKPVYLYSSLFPYEIIKRIETTLKDFLLKDGIENVIIEETDIAYTDGNKFWDNKMKAPASAYVLYQPRFNVKIQW